MRPQILIKLLTLGLDIRTPDHEATAALLKVRANATRSQKEDLIKSVLQEEEIKNSDIWEKYTYPKPKYNPYTKKEAQRKPAPKGTQNDLIVVNNLSNSQIAILKSILFDYTNQIGINYKSIPSLSKQVTRTPRVDLMISLFGKEEVILQIKKTVQNWVKTQEEKGKT